MTFENLLLLKDKKKKWKKDEKNQRWCIRYGVGSGFTFTNYILETCNLPYYLPTLLRVSFEVIKKFIFVITF